MPNTGYAFNFTGHGVFTPDGLTEITPEQVDAHNLETEAEELAWLKTAPERVMLYVRCVESQAQKLGWKDARWEVHTWLGTVLDANAWVGDRCNVGFGFHTYRRAVTCRIFGTLYHGWYFESSGDYARLRKAKRQ